MNILTKVFGIVSMSPVIKVEADMEVFLQAARRLIEKSPGAKTLRVSCRRADKSFPLTSPEVGRLLGSRLLDVFPDLSVDLHNPDLTINVEIRSDDSMVFSETIAGPGGMPVGCSGKGILLLSGGLDSPVAGWMAMKRGIKITALHFFSFPYTGEQSKKKVIDLSEKIAMYNQNDIQLLIVNFTAIQETIWEHCPEKFRVTIMRRMMLRITERIAKREGALAIITGESVGQVASQTLESMSVIGQSCSMLQLKPLVGMDKTEIIDRARKIDTYDISILPFEDCCSLFVPRHPVTRPALNQVIKAEEGSDWETLIEQAVDEVEKLHLVAPTEYIN
jgi:thiamine biosynthesis protein ThiI